MEKTAILQTFFIISRCILLNFRMKPHTPCFTLIEQALSVFFNVNYI